MNVGSLFSGIGGLDEGLRRAGHQHVFFCESDAYRRDVLRARFPGVPVYDDVRDVGIRESCGERRRSDEQLTRQGRSGGIRSVSRGDASDQGRPDAGHRIDLLCGGFPCQDLSVAGKRAGLAGDRSGLFFEFARIIESVRPGWLLVENVPGLLSSNGGRDFGVVLGTLADLGYGVAWRIVDSRFFGVPQRRRRVFIVGAKSVGDPRAAAERAGEVLAVGQGCDRHLAPRGEARPHVAYALADGSGTRTGSGRDGQETLISETVRSHPRPGSNSNGNLVAGTLKSQRGKGGGGISPEETLVAATLKSQDGRGWSHDAEATYVAAPLTKGSATGEGVNQPGRRQEDDVNIVAFHPTGGGAKGLSETEDLAPGTGTGSGGTVGVADAAGVRRLTPTECERLQGFDDGWTQLGDTPDSRRYSALRDAVTVNVSEWIGRRLAA